LILNHKRWNFLPPLPKGHSLLASGLPPLVAQLLYNRGITEPSGVEAFLKIDKRLSPDPFLLPDMEVAVGRIYRAMLGAEKVAIYGDFDADGITSTALLIHGLSSLGINTTFYIPHRLNEGHGLKTAALENLRDSGVSLVISVDCGITGADAVRKAQHMGMDVIITDHHATPPEVPPALAVIDPKLPGVKYPFIELAGVGVAYKLLQAVLTGLGKESTLEEVIDLVALGTVADMTPLLGENRFLVKEGLKRMNSNLRLGLREMLARAGLAPGNLTSESITWTIAPRINTASRLEDALPSYELLMTNSADRASELSYWLEKKNTERQRMTNEATTHAREQVMATGLEPILMVEGVDYPAGVAGLVASHLTNEYYRPSAIIRAGKKISTGSCRSIPEFNIIEALNQCHDLFMDFGGHAQAAGFVMLSRNLPHLRDRLYSLAEKQLDGVDLRPRIDIDAEVSLRDLAGDAYKTIQQMAPFGMNNPVPTFVTRKVKVISCRTMGTTSDHLRLKLEHGGIAFDAVAFGCGSRIKEITTQIDVAYNLELDQWNGRDTLRLNLVDFNGSAG
jgi:single-stranded-DNA-specific exonuclease